MSTENEGLHLLNGFELGGYNRSTRRVIVVKQPDVMQIRTVEHFYGSSVDCVRLTTCSEKRGLYCQPDFKRQSDVTLNLNFLWVLA